MAARLAGSCAGFGQRVRESRDLDGGDSTRDRADESDRRRHARRRSRRCAIAGPSVAVSHARRSVYTAEVHECERVEHARRPTYANTSWPPPVYFRSLKRPRCDRRSSERSERPTTACRRCISRAFPGFSSPETSIVRSVTAHFRRSCRRMGTGRMGGWKTPRSTRDLGRAINLARQGFVVLHL